MKIVLAVILGYFVASAFVVPILMRHPRAKKKYARMDDRKLVATNTQARLAKRMTWIMAFLNPLVLILVGSLLPHIWNLVIPAALILSVGCLACARVFREMEFLTTVEMDFRKFRVEKEAKGRESDSAGASTE